MGKKDKTTPSPVLGSKGMIAGIIIIAVIILTVVVIFATGNAGGSAAVPPEECGKTVISYVNTNLAAGKCNRHARLGDREGWGVPDRSALPGAESDFLRDKELHLHFLRYHNMKPTPTPPPPPCSPPRLPRRYRSGEISTAVRGDLRHVVLPVRGPGREPMNPVIGLLGTKADFTVRYIATVNGTTLDSVKSLHGLAEAKEDLRQLCLAKYYPEKVWPYLTDFNAQCYPVYTECHAAGIVPEECYRNPGD